MFDALTYAEKTALTESLLRGLTRAGKLATYARGDYHLWTAAAAVQSELCELHQELITMSLAGHWDAELRALHAGRLEDAPGRACLHCKTPVSADGGYYELTRQPGGAASGQSWTLCSLTCLEAFVR